MKKKYQIISFYKFMKFSSYTLFEKNIRNFCVKKNIKGTVLLAEEGINATMAGSREAISALLTFLKQDVRFDDIDYKKSFADEIPFHRFKIKIKKEIVTLGQEGVEPNITTGVHVDPNDWNSLISDPELILIDTRNKYEYQIGSFKKAISPNTKNFRDFPAFIKKTLSSKKNKKIALFCTGGIRCEKASSYMIKEGFKKVYQLHGGILNYIKKVDSEESLWEGECFVFDSRVSVDNELAEGKYEQCFACRRPLSAQDMKSSEYQKGISCPKCINEKSEKKKESFRERQRQVELAEERNDKHIGARMD
tara:strand:- start:389 stop:1309 length:921 start_codon:yes stop_codon:yes gene_type:complete